MGDNRGVYAWWTIAWVVVQSTPAPIPTAPTPQTIQLPDLTQAFAPQDKRAHQAIQDKKFLVTHQLQLFAAFFPSEPLSNILSGGLSYTWYPQAWLGWNVIQAHAAQNQAKPLQDEIKTVTAGTAQQTDTFPHLGLLLTSHVLLQPFYGKQSFLAKGDIHLTSYILLGPATARIDHSDDSRWVWGVDAGLGTRIFITSWTSLALELYSLTLWPKRADPDHLLRMQLAWAVHL